MIGNEREMVYVMIFGTINDILGYIYKTGSILKKANNYYDKSIIYLPRQHLLFILIYCY